jgi:ADP-ribosylglycohydrolase
VTHNQPEGIKGAQATAAAIFMARQGASKPQIEAALEERFAYTLTPSIDELRPGYEFDETCQGTLPAALIAFLESSDYEDAVRKAISLGGDADTSPFFHEATKPRLEADMTRSRLLSAAMIRKRRE